MNIRESYENKEITYLSSDAVLSKNTKGRKNDEEKCPIRTEFQRDRDRIIHSKAFRRLKHKTQVFISPEGDHYRTRLTHTLEVSQVARSISRALSLNEDLTEAIALAHDLGHTPFGHSGESVLNEICKHGFRHYIQSLRVVEHLEPLNLTYEVKDGIINHSSSKKAKTFEGRVVRVADKIAYINHDIDDAIRAGIITEDMIPNDAKKILGYDSSSRINTMITNVINNYEENGEIDFYNNVGEVIWSLREYMFKNVYIGSTAKDEEIKAMNILKQMYSYYLENPKKLPIEFYNNIETYSIDTVVCDYLAGMTDRYAMSEFLNIFAPTPWGKIY